MMRIISGIRRGKKLLTLAGDSTRPTLERVKQAFFNAIQFEIDGRVVLDLFSGSGQLGLEALSRGAQYCFFNDYSPQACKIIDKNIKACGFDQLCELTCKTYTECVKMIGYKGKKISLVFLDPPYGKNLISDALETMCKANILDTSCIVVCESSKTDIAVNDNFSLRQEYCYSDTKITILERRNDI